MDVYLFPVIAGFDGTEDLDVEVFEFEHAVAYPADVAIDEEIGVDVAGVGSELTECLIILRLPRVRQPSLCSGAAYRLHLG